jgi:hypothetical protein
MKMKTDSHRIDRLGKGCWQLVDMKTEKQVGVYPTLKETKATAGILAPANRGDDYFDEDELLVRARNALVRGGGDIPSAASEVIREFGRVYVHLVNVRGTLAIYRYCPQSDKLRKVQKDSLEGACLPFTGAC